MIDWLIGWEHLVWLFEMAESTCKKRSYDAVKRSYDAAFKIEVVDYAEYYTNKVLQESME